jgi:hypothetical protein
MKTLSRSTALKIAAGISLVLSAVSVYFALPMVVQGAANIDQGAAGPPFVVVMIGFVTGVVGIVAAYPTWKGQRWGIILTILANLINGLSAAPGLLFAPDTVLLVAASATVLFTVVIVVLCLWPDRKPALA